MTDLDHVSVAVRDYDKSKAFYRAALEPLGMRLIMEGVSGAGFGRHRPHFWIRRGEPQGSVHVSFRADSREEVEAFHAAGLAAGGRDFGAPGVRAQYHPGYFGAFVLDPDGHNIEAVRHESAREPVVLMPEQGRAYDMGRIQALFKADMAETAFGYSVSEWWLEPQTHGPGPHAHPEDDLFFVLEGTMSVLVGERWVDAPRGAFVLAPGGVVHDFENRTSERAGLLNFCSGIFEPHMKSIVEWFREHPAGDVKARDGG